MLYDKTEISVAGNLGTKPTLRHTSKKTPVSNFRIAISQGKDIEPEWWSIVVFGEQAKRCLEDFEVGDRIMVVGTVRIRPYETNDGQTRFAHEIWSNDVGLSNKWNSVISVKVKRSSTNGASTPIPSDDEIDAHLSSLEEGEPEVIQQPATGMHAEDERVPETVPPSSDNPDDDEPF